MVTPETHELEKLMFDNLAVGDALAITTQNGEREWEYYFVVDELGQWPRGRLGVRDPGGLEVEELTFELHGCSRWWALPEQKSGITIGGFVGGIFAGSSSRYVLGEADQEVSHIAHYRATP